MKKIFLLIALNTCIYTTIYTAGGAGGGAGGAGGGAGGGGVVDPLAVIDAYNQTASTIPLLTFTNANYRYQNVTQWFEGSSQLLSMSVTYPSLNPPTSQEANNLFTVVLNAPATIALNTPIFIFNLQKNIFQTSLTAIKTTDFYPRYQGNQNGTFPPDAFLRSHFVFFKENSTSFSIWFTFVDYLMYYRKFIKTYTFLDTSLNTATTIPFSNSYTFTDKKIGSLANLKETYNNVTITFNGTTTLPLSPTLTFTFKQVRDTGTITNTYTIDANRLMTITPIDVLTVNDIGAHFDRYMNAFLNSTTEPLLAYYSLMWFVASYSQKYPSFYVTHNTQETTINMTGYSTDLFLNAVPQLTTSPTDITNNTLPLKPLIRIPIVNTQSFRATQYVTSEQFDITNTTALRVLNTLLISYIGENTTQNSHYFALLAQINPNLTTTFGAQLPKPYDQAFSLQGNPINSTVIPPIYFQLAYIINDVLKPAPYIRINISKLNNAQSIQLGALLFHFLVSKGILSTKTWYHLLAWYMIALLNAQTTSYTGFVPFLDNKGNVTSSILLPNTTQSFPTLEIIEATNLINNIIRSNPNANLPYAAATLGIPSLLQNTQAAEPLISTISSTTTNVEALNSAAIQDFLSRLVALYVITKNTTFTFTTPNSIEKTNSITAYNQARYYLQQFYTNPYLRSFIETTSIPPLSTYPNPLDGEFQNSSFAKRFTTFNNPDPITKKVSSFLYPTGGSNALEAIINDCALQYISTLSFLSNSYSDTFNNLKKATTLKNLIMTIEYAFTKFYNYTLATRYNILKGAAS